MGDLTGCVEGAAPLLICAKDSDSELKAGGVEGAEPTVSLPSTFWIPTAVMISYDQSLKYRARALCRDQADGSLTRIASLLTPCWPTMAGCRMSHAVATPASGDNAAVAAVQRAVHPSVFRNLTNTIHLKSGSEGTAAAEQHARRLRGPRKGKKRKDETRINLEKHQPPNINKNIHLPPLSSSSFPSLPFPDRLHCEPPER